MDERRPSGGLGGFWSVENEWLCSKIMDAYGIPTASCEIERFDDQKVLIVERFKIIPEGFPMDVADAIFAGMEKQALRLRAG